MRVSALASGSSGNCFYINHDKSSILVDAGISCKQVVERLSWLNQDPRDIRGIFITHEHTDHIKGVDVLARRFSIPIFATKGTINSCFLCSNEELINEIKDDEIVKIAGMEVRAFSKMHQAKKPVSFAIQNSKMVSIITDLGKACKNVTDAVRESDFLAIESNHDTRMLEDGPYPYFLKKWINSDTGHLSNFHSAVCVLEHAKSGLKNVLLSHLSEKNNIPMLAFNTFNSLMKERVDLHPKISLSLRNPTELFQV